MEADETGQLTAVGQPCLARLSSPLLINLYDISYALGVAVASPVWLLKPAARRKVLKAFRERMGHIPPAASAAPAVMIHAVSLGEINATRGLVMRLHELRPGLRIIISATTVTGHARAMELYGKLPLADFVTVIHYPLDFTPAIARVLDNLRPSAIVLMELEAWPNFILQCGRRGIPVLLVNGRMTEPSFKRYRLALPIVRRMFSRLALVCTQEQPYVKRFIALGAAADRVRITGTMKFDTATVAERIEGDLQLAADMGLETGETAPPLWVCGSTGPGEERIVLEAYRQLLADFPTLRLAIIPRKPERFDEVAGLIQGAGFAVVRRSGCRSDGGEARRHEGTKARGDAVLLGDTMGELRKFYSLASVVFVGRTLVDLGAKQHGSDMMEPAALGKPVIVGPYTGNFADVMSRFREAKAIREIDFPTALATMVRELLRDATSARELGERARRVVIEGKGATERHVQAILDYLPPASHTTSGTA